MGWACGTNVGGEESSRELTRNTEEKRRRRRFWRRLDDNIKMGIQQIEWEDRYCLSLVEDRKKWRPARNLRVQ
jgi:hypothetical protein